MNEPEGHAETEEFLGTAEELRREQITHVTLSAENTRHYAGNLTISEAYAAFKYELDTFQRGSVMYRLRQRIRGRACELIDQHLDFLENEYD